MSIYKRLPDNEREFEQKARYYVGGYLVDVCSTGSRTLAIQEYMPQNTPSINVGRK